MKKLFLLLAVGGFMMVSCNVKQSSPDPEQPDSTALAQQEQQKKAKADWENWDNLSDERKEELLNEQKALYDYVKAVKEAREARMAKFEAAMENWDNLTLDERKAAIDLMSTSPAKQEGATNPKAINQAPSSK